MAANILRGCVVVVVVFSILGCVPCAADDPHVLRGTPTPYTETTAAITTDDAIFAFIGDSFTVQCRQPTPNSNGAGSDDDPVTLSIYKNGRRLRQIMPIVTTTLTPAATASSAVSSPSRPSSSTSPSTSPSSSLSPSPSPSQPLPSGTKGAFNSNSNNSSVLKGMLNITKDLIGTNLLVCETPRNETIQMTALYVQGPITVITNVSAVWVYDVTTRLNVSWAWGWASVEEFVDVDIVWSASGPPASEGFACNSTRHTSCLIYNIRYPNEIYFRVTVSVKDELSSKYHAHQSLTTTTTTATPTPSVTAEGMTRFLSGFTAVFNFSVDPLESVKTRRPAPFQLTFSSNQCLHVSWDVPPFFRHFNEEMLYSIDVRVSKKHQPALFQALDNGVKKVSGNLPWNNPVVAVCGLHPGTVYSLSLRVKSPRGGHWSEPANLLAKTKEDKPDRGPETTDTSFWSGPCFFGRRTIVLYWKDIPHNVTNGQLTDFLVNVTSWKFKARPMSNHVTFRLSCKETYRVEIYSATNAGLTDSPSVLVVPSQEEELKTPSWLGFTVTKMPVGSDSSRVGAVNITWTCADPVMCSGNYFLDVYHCRGETFSTNTCIDDIHHHRVPLQNETFVISSVPNMTDRFGFALTDGGDVLQGITWTRCVVDANKVPLPPTGVAVLKGEDAHTVFVRWDIPTCSDSTKALVGSYRIIYCKNGSSDRNDSCSVVSVAGTESSTTIAGLDEQGSYSVRVVATSTLGKDSPESHTLTVSLSQESHATGDSQSQRNVSPVIVIVVCTLIPTLVMGAVIGLFLRKFRQRMTLANNDLRSMGLFTPIDSDIGDSGVGTSPDPT